MRNTFKILIYFGFYIESSDSVVLFNISNAEIRILQDNQVITIAADALAPCITKSSAAIALTMQDKWVLVFHREGIWVTCAILVLRNCIRCINANAFDLHILALSHTYDPCFKPSH